MSFLEIFLIQSLSLKKKDSLFRKKKQSEKINVFAIKNKNLKIFNKKSRVI